MSETVTVQGAPTEPPSPMDVPQLRALEALVNEMASKQYVATQFIGGWAVQTYDDDGQLQSWGVFPSFPSFDEAEAFIAGIDACLAGIERARDWRVFV